MLRPLQLVSLWEMLRPYAQAFAASSRSFGHFTSAMYKAPKKFKLGKFVDLLRRELDAVVYWAALVELTSLPPKAERIKAKLHPDTLIADLAGDFLELCERMEDELRSREFLYVPPRQVDYYREPLKGWTEAAEKFPSAQFDIEEAGKCLALGRQTACVLHLMRVLETGLGAMSKKLDVSFEQRAWGGIISDLQGKVNSLGDNNRKSADWKDQQHFFSECVADLKTFKNAWRNYALHGHEKFGDEEASHIYTGVQHFMRRLSERLSES